MTKCQITCKSLQKSSKCQNFLRVWHLVIFRADQLQKPPCILLGKVRTLLEWACAKWAKSVSGWYPLDYWSTCVAKKLEKMSKKRFSILLGHVPCKCPIQRFCKFPSKTFYYNFVNLCSGHLFLQIAVPDIFPSVLTNYWAWVWWL